MEYHGTVLSKLLFHNILRPYWVQGRFSDRARHTAIAFSLKTPLSRAAAVMNSLISVAFGYGAQQNHTDNGMEVSICRRLAEAGRSLVESRILQLNVY